ncbi:MAG: hypothetical protein R3277_12615 [Brumimicrobium sp.]|nr:hypothetical protein [Brumimicrobium sp.]
MEGAQVMAAVYILAGTMHFVFPRTYVKIIPPYIPLPRTMVYLSGFFEVLFGGLLLFPQTRSYAAMGIILLLLAVFPANIYMAQRMKARNNPYTWVAYLRLPLQGVLIYWAYLYI